MQTLLVDQPADGVTRITLNRPDKLDALTYELVSELHTVLREVDADHSCRAVILTGAGRGFCAGLDLNGFGVVDGTEEQGRVHRGFAVQQLIADVMQHLRSISLQIVIERQDCQLGHGGALPHWSGWVRAVWRSCSDCLPGPSIRRVSSTSRHKHARNGTRRSTELGMETESFVGQVGWRPCTWFYGR